MAEKRDPGHRDISTNFLLLILAARNGPHAEKIDQFISDNAWLYRFYGLDTNEAGWLPEEGASALSRFIQTRSLLGKFKKRLRGQQVSADGLVR